MRQEHEAHVARLEQLQTTSLAAAHAGAARAAATVQTAYSAQQVLLHVAQEDFARASAAISDLREQVQTLEARASVAAAEHVVLVQRTADDAVQLASLEVQSVASRVVPPYTHTRAHHT